MSDFDSYGYDDVEPEESFSRPFLAHSAAPAPVIPHHDVDHEEESFVTHDRPYLLTGGRTGGGESGISIETLLIRSLTTPAQPSWTKEMNQILGQCDEPVAVAEVAARIHLPIGVVQVLAGDLVTAGALIRSEANLSLADDVLFIERLINGVAAL